MIMSKVKFKPWVGKDYACGKMFGKRLMILGESHHHNGSDAETDDESDTKIAIMDYMYRDQRTGEYQPCMNTFLKFERSLVGKYTDFEDSRRIWDSLLFYNYLQESVLSPRQAGRQEQYAESFEAYLEVLEHYRPEAIIVWGFRLWGMIPEGERWSPGQPIGADGKNYTTGFYSLCDGTKIPVMAVKHPSAGYDWEHWYKIIQAFLEKLEK